MSHNKQKAVAIYGISDWVGHRGRALLMKMEMAAIRIQELAAAAPPPFAELSTQIYYLPPTAVALSFGLNASPFVRLSLAQEQEEEKEGGCEITRQCCACGAARRSLL